MTQASTLRLAIALACGSLSAALFAEPVTYVVDSSHTFPAFEADHQGGLSIWRGKIKSTSGTVVLDKTAGSGSVDISMEMASIDFGHDAMNEHAMNEDILDVQRYPTATYVGELARFVNGSPTAIEGSLTMHGVSRPVNLAIERFKCQPHFRHGREVCGADASATIDREEFGVDYDKENGFFMDVKLLITIEAQIPAE
jgi:polyisoprenoid-binding protein YceI